MTSCLLPSCLLFFSVSFTANSKTLREAINLYRQEIQARSDFGVPQFSTAQIQDMQNGETVWLEQEDTSGDTLLTIAGRVEAPPEAIWIAILDDAHNGLSDRITEHQLSSPNGSKKRLYQHLSLPYPLSDRHWILEIQSDSELHRASQGRVWRRAWRLDPQGEGALERLSAREKALVKKGVWTPENKGEWLILPDSNHCWVLYRGQFDIGGRIPAFVSKTVGNQSTLDLFNELQRLASEVPTHYTSSHTPIMGPSGQAIERW